MKRLLPVVSAVLLMVGLVACTEDPPPEPVSTVDASFTGPRTKEVWIYAREDASLVRFAQTFTAGRSGTLDKVSVILGPAWAGPVVPVTVSVQTLAGGKPSGEVLGWAEWDGPAPPDQSTFVDLELSEPAEVVAGEQYALVFENPSTTWMTVQLGQPDYPDGQAWEHYSFWSPDPYSEVPFKTWVR